MMAKREHAKRLVPLLEQLIKESGIETETFESSKESLENIKKICGDHDEDLWRSIMASYLIKEKPAVDRIAVTEGPGLEPALWVGINFANALGSLWNIPVAGVNHMEGHIVASLLPKTETKYAFESLLECSFPAIAFLISGGHTEIVLVKGIQGSDPRESQYKVLGQTRDDAIGEAFDKVARMLGLPYPGGPEISRLAEMERNENGVVKEKHPRQGTPSPPAGEASRSRASRAPRGPSENVSLPPLHINFPRPMINADILDMSFAGLKTAVLYELRKHETIDEPLKKEIAREFEDAVTDVILAKLERAFDEHSAYTLIAGGGVFANKHILEACKNFCAQHGIAFLPPASGLSGDNALMIAMAGAINSSSRNADENEEKETKKEIRANGNLSL